MSEAKPGDVVNLHGGRVWYEVRTVWSPTEEDPCGQVQVARHERGKASYGMQINGLAWADIVGHAATIQRGVS